jgi:anaerobic ribonucleoside-triphosphate reductase activating protein
MTARLMVNRAHYPVTTLGPGLRAGIWVQGCTIGCHGCASRDTWEADPSRLVDVEQLAGWLAALPRLDGLTVTGGEPFQQPDAVRALLDAVRGQAAERRQVIDILVYSGYTYGALSRRGGAAEVLARCDAAITGPYVDRLNPGGPWRGSANQKLVILSQLGRERFGPAEDAAGDPTAGDATAGEQRLQLSSDGQRLWLIGIPGHGDLGRLEHELASRGVTLEGHSWLD